ncbi:MAG TPA: glycosyltransferase [Candidatus Saccharimonadales bacterium]|nr:glycosyltransferase [Candidatus Saccharimonadales bacterium]
MAERKWFRRVVHGLVAWAGSLVSSSLILGILFFIVVSFYVFSSIITLNSFFYVFLLLSLLTDGLFIFIHLHRRRIGRRKVSFNPATLTIIIPCHNGEDIIEETIRNAQKHVPSKQIIVVSDASTDQTAEVARATGVRVLVNPKNLQKVNSINAAMLLVKTPYVLILDDDTLIGDTFIPTSLLDDGYSAVAFNVMPVEDNTLINRLQRFEYRVSMQVSKNLRATKGAIGNVSGAIGLFRTDDLLKQITLHSGQFAGEDEQRTLLVHLYGEGKGVTYTNSLVYTKPPTTYRKLFRQRAFSWSISTPELFTLYWRVLLSPKFHYLLKADKAYLMYIYLTDPLRILFIWAIFMRPANALLAYGFYFVLNLLIWLRLGCKDSLGTIIVMPFYTLGLTICRFIAHFYWLVEKSRYLSRQLHRPVRQRWLLGEYALVLAIIGGSWALSVNHFMSDVHMFQKIQSEQLTSDQSSFQYDLTAGSGVIVDAPPDAPYLVVEVDQGDNQRALAHKAVAEFLAYHPELFNTLLNYDARYSVDNWLAQHLPPYDPTMLQMGMRINKSLIMQAIATVQGPQQ